MGFGESLDQCFGCMEGSSRDAMNMEEVAASAHKESDGHP